MQVQEEDIKPQGTDIWLFYRLMKISLSPQLLTVSKFLLYRSHFISWRSSPCEQIIPKCPLNIHPSLNPKKSSGRRSPQEFAFFFLT